MAAYLLLRLNKKFVLSFKYNIFLAIPYFLLYEFLQVFLDKLMKFSLMFQILLVFTTSEQDFWSGMFHDHSCILS